MSKFVEVIVDSTGKTQIQTKGFAGSACLEASKFLESALGKRVADKLTAEFHVISASGFASERQSAATSPIQRGA